MKTTLREIRKAPFYPLVPFVPLFVAGAMLALEAFALARLRRLARSIDALVAQRYQPGGA